MSLGRWIRRPGFTASALGAVVCGLVGSGLIALTSDSVTSVGNHLESSDFVEPEHDLQLAVGGSGNVDDCGSAPFLDETVGPMSLSDEGVMDLDLGAGSSILYQSNNYCIRNAGNVTTYVSAYLTAVQQTETGCSEPEAAAEPAGVCGSTGELAGQLTVTVEPWSASGECSGTETLASRSFAQMIEGRAAIAVLEPGEVCVVYFRFLFSGAESDKVAVQTDAITMDVVFIGGDPVIGPVGEVPGGTG